MWSPLRARKLDKKGLLKPFVRFEYFGNPKTLNCDRDSQGDVYFVSAITKLSALSATEGFMASLNCFWL